MDLSQTRSASPKWKSAAFALGLLAVAPFFVGGSAALAFRIALGVGAVGLVIFAVVAQRKRGLLKPLNTPVRVLTRSTLGPRTGIAVLEFDGRRLLVGFGDGFAQVLSASRPARRRATKEVAP